MRVVRRAQSRAVRRGGRHFVHSLAFPVATRAGRRRRMDAFTGYERFRRAGIRGNGGTRPFGRPAGVGALQPPPCDAHARSRRDPARDAAGAYPR